MTLDTRHLLTIFNIFYLFQGSGHELYGGFGYSPMLFNSSPMEQAMPATGLGLGPGNISPGSIGPGPPPQMVQGLPPHYNGSYHPSYIGQQNIQVKPTKFLV